MQSSAGCDSTQAAQVIALCPPHDTSPPFLASNARDQRRSHRSEDACVTLLDPGALPSQDSAALPRGLGHENPRSIAAWRRVLLRHLPVVQRPARILDALGVTRCELLIAPRRFAKHRLQMGLPRKHIQLGTGSVLVAILLQ